MSNAWSLYISVLTLGTLLAMAWLLYATRSGAPPAEENPPPAESVDGIEEQDNPLPRWWRWLFISTLVFALVYLALYPGLGNWRGLLPGAEGNGWSSTGAWAQDYAHAQARYAPLYARFAALPLPAVAADPQAHAMGARLFAQQCAQCHGADGQGAPGFPDLTDALWRWGGDPAALETSIRQGRIAVMPAWGALLGEQGSRDAAAYVLHLNGRPVPADSLASPANGQRLYSQACVACHGADARGNPLLGAPDLTHASGFIYGSSFEQVRLSIHEGRQGHMPALGAVLGDDRVHVLAGYVLSLARAPVAPAPVNTQGTPEAAP